MNRPRSPGLDAPDKVPLRERAATLLRRGSGTWALRQEVALARNRLPYMQFDVDDYLQDEAVMGMDADTEGLYIRLLCRSWKSSTPGVIPMRLLSVMCEEHRVTEQYRILWSDEYAKLNGDALPEVGPEMIADVRMEQVRTQLMAAFDTSSRPDFWIQKRMVADFRRLNAIYEAQKKGGEQTRFRQPLPRSPEGDQQDTSSLPREEVDVEVDLDSEESKEKPTPVVSRSRARRVRDVLLVPNLPPPPGVEPETWGSWFVFRASIKKPLNAISEKMCVKKLTKFYEDGFDPDQILESSIANGWQGLFAPNEELKARNGHVPQKR